MRMKKKEAKKESSNSEETMEREREKVEELVRQANDEFTFCRTLIRGQLYRAGVCLHTMNRAFSIDVTGRLTPICCAFCSLPGFSDLPLNKYLKEPAHRRDVSVNILNAMISVEYNGV